jgi:hypothetical protein
VSKNERSTEDQPDTQRFTSATFLTPLRHNQRVSQRYLCISLPRVSFYVVLFSRPDCCRTTSCIRIGHRAHWIEWVSCLTILLSQVSKMFIFRPSDVGGCEYLPQPANTTIFTYKEKIRFFFTSSQELQILRDNALHIQHKQDSSVSIQWNGKSPA